MNQQAIDWLLSQEPGAPTIVPENQPAPPKIANNDDLFADIPTTAQQQQQQAANSPNNEVTVKDDLFADIPVTPQAIEQEPSLWGQFKAGIADVASGYYSNKALQQAEEYQRIKDNKTGLLGLSKLGMYDVNTGVISPNKEQELKEREEEIAAALKKSQEYQTYSENMPMPESVRNFLDPTRESHSSWWEDLKVAPVEIAFNVTAKSAPASLLSLGGAMAGGVTAGLPGAMAGSGAVSGRIEYINSIKQGLQEAGIDWTDPQAFISAINNDELMDPIREKGLKRGIAIGTLDAAAALVGGKVLAPKSLFAKSAAKAQGINLPAQVVAQAGLGAGGEAAGQYWSEGEITDVRAIAAEAVGEMTFAPVEATATLYSVSRGSKGIARDRLKATNELLDILNRKRQKAFNSRDPQAIAKANTEFNEYLNIRQELEQQLKNTDAESLLKAEKTLSTVIDAKQRQYNQANAEQRPALERELKELNKRRDVVFDAIHSQGRTIQSPELMEQKEALDLVKADREFRQEQRRAEEEELFYKRTNPLAAADEEARKIAEQGGDALDQQLAASNAYSSARSTDEMADDIASMEGARQATEREQDLIEEIRRTEQQYADSQGLKKIVAQKKLKNLQQQLQTLRSQPVEEAPTDVSDTNVVDTASPTTPTEEPYQPKSLYQIVREGKERRAREGDWEAAEAQAQAQEAEQTQQEIAAWEASQGITEQEAIRQRRQENLHNELRKAWQQVHQQSVNEAHGIIDEAMALGLIDDEASARQLADNGEIPPDLPQRIANEKRLLAREKAETDREAFVEKQQHRQKVARLEQHIADQQKARDYERAIQQRDENLADITEGEINDWEEMLGITQEAAIDEAAQARQARQPAPEPVAETKAEPTAEALLAERIRYAHQVVDAAIKNGSIGLLGEPLARQYADRGEIPPSLMSEADQLADQISRLEQHIQSGQQADQARTGWTAEQPAPGAMQEQSATEYTPVERKPPEQESPATPENVSTEPENVSVLEEPAQTTQESTKETNQQPTPEEQAFTGVSDNDTRQEIKQTLKQNLKRKFAESYQGNKGDAPFPFVQSLVNLDFEKAIDDVARGLLTPETAIATANKAVEDGKAITRAEADRFINQVDALVKEEQFESQLKQIGKEWIKDQQHRFYFSDIIQQLSGTDQPIPANAKLWYDKRTGFYGSENLSDEVYDAAVERLELLRQSIIDEHGEQALEPVSPESEQSLNNETIKTLNNDQEESTQSLEDLKALHRDLINQRNEAEYQDIQAGRTPTSNARLDDRIRQTEDAIKQMEQEQPDKIEGAGIRGFTNESGNHTFNKEDGSTETFEYNRVADLDKVSGSPDTVAPFFVELKEGDLLLDRSKRKMGVVSHTKGGKIHFKGEREPWPINVEVHKDDRRKLGDEIRRLKAEQKGKPAPKEPTVTTEETPSENQWVRITPDDIDQLPIGSTIRISTGTPKPTAKQAKKLKEWEKFNVTGTLKEKGNYGGTPHLTLFKGMNGFMPNQSMYPMHPDLIFEVEQQPGTVSDNETIKSLNNDQEQTATTEPQGNRSKPIESARFNTPLEFGKHKGKTINEIGAEDRGYLRKIADSPFKNNEQLAADANEWLNKNGNWSDRELNSFASSIAAYALHENGPFLSMLDTKLFGRHATIDIRPGKNHVDIIEHGVGKKKNITHKVTYKALSKVLTEEEITRLKKLAVSDTVESPPSIETTSETTPDEGTRTTGQGTLEGVPPGEVQETTGSGNLGERSPDHTGQSSQYDNGTDGRGSRDELGGSPAPSVSGIDIHGAGSVSQGEVGTGGTDRAGGINSDSVDYSITAQDEIESASFSDTQKYQGNIAAIKLLKELGQRPATLEQKKVLARYVGWGGLKQAFFREDGTTRKGWEKQAAELKALLTPEEYEAARASTLNAHYTSWDVVHPIFQALKNIGFTGGRMLEPSMGVGNFFGMMPSDMRRKSRLVGVELDNITGGIAQKLYGNSARIHAPRGFESFDLADSSYDVVIGNPPFGDETITDSKRKDISGLRIHNYFFAKGMKALRPGGVMAMVVSKGFMDSSKNQKGRDMMFREARLLGAFRLPNQAFKANANADVTTDIIFLQKREVPLEPGEVDVNDYRNRAEFVGADGNIMQINQYFVDNPKHLLGDMIMNTGRFGPDLEPAMTTRKGLDWKKALIKGVAKLEGRYNPEANIELHSATGTPDASTDIQRAEIDGLYINDQGQLSRRLPDLEGDTQGKPVTSYTNNQGKVIELKPAQINKLTDAVKLARKARHLINMQVTDMTDPQLEPLRQELSRDYDAFVKKYHMLNRPLFKSLLNQTDLTIAPMLFALENGYKKERKVNGKTVKESSSKADIFTRRTQEPFTQVTKVSSAEEALIVALSQTGKVDLDRMSELSGISRTALVSQLTDIIYDDPVAGWVTRDEYLSGNVKRKLRQAREMGRGYEDNVKALEAVQPVDIPATEIITTLGAHWQTPEVINQFWTHLGGQLAQSTFVPERSTWTFTGSETSNKHKWRTDEMTMKDLVKSLLNNKAIAVYKTDPITEKRTLDVRATDAALAKATEIQNEFLAWLWRDTQRREAMVRRYNDLVNTDVNRQFDGSFLTFPGKVSDAIVKLRKTQANAVWRIVQSATTLLDHVVGAGKTFTMVAAAMELKRTGLAKKPMIVVPNHLVAQWAEDFARLYPNAKILAATKQDFSAKRRKEMLARIATGNWDAVIIAHSSFGKMPTDPETEQWFIRKQIEELTVAANALREAEGKGTRSVREAENARKKLKEKLKELIENTDKDVGMTWNETGVDALFVDEAHEFKNLQFFTSMNRVKNINPAGSKKAQDLFIKIQALLNKTGGRNLVFATGTPVSNSMAELYTMQRYLSHEQLVESGTNHFDAWARTFGTTVTNQERTSSGKYGPVSRFSEFINLPELITKYKGFADTINNEDIRKALAEEGKGIHIPSVKGGKPQAVVAPRSVYQEAYMGQIEYRFENMPDDPRVDNPLKATNDARKAGLDMRMIYPELPDDPSSKINKSVKNMMRLYNQWSDDKGTQLVFCDLSTPKSQQAKEIKDFRTMVEEAAKDDDNQQNTKGMDVQELYDYLQSMADNGNEKAISRLEKVTQDDIEGWTSKFDVYNDVKTKLMEAGVPEAEIAFIHNANTDTQKQDLFDKVNRGEIRFLLGSTAKMGAGTNVQERLVGLHHLDAPWRPSDLEQREGRIIRQGNKLFLRDPEGFEVEIMRYATEQTYDVNMWQMLEVKALFIQQLRNGSLTDRTAKDVGGEAASAAEMKAASSGDPRIIEQVALLARLKTLDNLRQTHIKDKTQATIKAESLEQNKRSLPKTIESYRQDYERREIPREGPGLKTPNGKTFKKSTDGSKWFKQQILTRLQDTESDIWFGAGEVIADFQGFEVLAKLTEVQSSIQSTREGPVYNLRLDLSGKRDYFIVSEDIENIKWDGLFTRFNNAIERIDTERAKRQDQLDNIDALIKEQEEIARSHFKEEAEYQQKLERNLALIEELGNEDTVNEPAKLLAEYQLLNALAEDYFNRTSENIAETLENTALGNRANKLARRILYSKEGDEKVQATEAIEQARDQGLTINEKDIKAAQKRIDEAEARRKLEEKKIKENAKNTGESTPVTAETTITFTSADEAIKHAQENKQAITADNGNIRLERSSLGNWQLSVAWQDKAGFDDDSIVMDTDLTLITGGRGFTAVGDKMVMTFKEDRLPVVIRRLYGKMPLQGVKADKTQKNPNVRFRRTDNSDNILLSTGDGKELDRHITKEEADREIERFKKEYNLQDIDFETYYKATDAPYGFPEKYNAARGLYQRGKNRVLIFYGRFGLLSDIRRTLRHETFVHLALDRKDNVFRQTIINQLANSIYKDKKLRNLLLVEGSHQGILERYSSNSVEIKAEEIMANIANEKIKTPIAKKLLFTINSLVRKTINPNIRLSYSSVQGIIAHLTTELTEGKLPKRLYDVDRKDFFTKEEIEEKLKSSSKTDYLIDHVEIIESIFDFPEHLRKPEYLEKKGIYDESDNSVYLIADQVTSLDDAVDTVLHEVVGHKGIRAVLGSDFETVMLSIFESMDEAQKQSMSYLNEMNPDDLHIRENKVLVAEELLSNLAETKPDHSLIRKFIAKFRAILRDRFGINVKWSHDDMVLLLNKSKKAMINNKKTTGVNNINDVGAIRFRSQDNSATITSPNNSNNPTDNANRLFSTLALAENELIRNALKVTGRKASSGMAHFRKLMLPSMGLRQIVDTYESVFDPMAADIDLATNTSKGNPIQKYQRYVQGMQSLKANKLAEADNVDIEWGKLAKENPTEYNELADMMHEATVYEVFPEKAYFIEHENMRELRRDYAREQNPAKQAELRKRIMFERERLGVYNKLSEQYQSMSQQAKDVYQAVEGFHENMWNDHQKALEEKITRSMQNSDEARAFIQQLKAQFHEAKVRGPYFPLQRFGSFYLIAEDQQGVYYREHYETEAQLYKHKEEIEKAGMSVLSFGLMPDFTSRKLEGVSGFAEQIHLALESDKFAGVSNAIKDEIRSEINQLALQMLPDVSAAKSMIRRRKVKGYSDNARRAFAFSAIHQSNRLARTVYGDQMTAELERIHDDIDSHNETPLIDMKQRTVAAQVLGELEKQHEKIMNPSGSPIAAKITNLAFIWYLGASAGAAFINMSQTVLIGIPLMGGRFGYRKTTAAVAKAAKDFGLHGYNKMSLRESMFTLSKATKGVTADEKRMLEQLIDDGTIDTTQTSTLSQISDQDLRADAQVNQDRWVKVNRMLGYFFHNAETANREVTALATYRMAREEGQTHENAVEIARKLTFDSHFDYSGANRPRVMKSDWVKVFTIFKQYSQNMTYTLVRNFVKSRPFSKFSAKEKKQARKALAGILFAHATAAGTLGLPLVSIIGPVLAEAFGDDDDEFRDWKTMYRNWLADLVGKDMGHAIAKGVFNGFMGTDIHARVKIDDLWIQEPNWEMSAREESMHYLLQGLGPASSAAINVLWLGPEQIADGNTWKGIEKMVPKFIRDGMRTIRYANEGATVGRGGYQAMIEEFTPGELARQFLGVSPSRVSEGYEARGAVKNLEQKISSRRGELMQGYTRAYMDGDYEKANRILTEIQKFNVSNPLYGITGDALRQSLRMKYRYKELSESGIYLPEAKIGLLNEARFAL